MVNDPQNRLDQRPEDKIETLTQSKKSKWPIVTIVIVLLALLLTGGYWYLYVYVPNHMNTDHKTEVNNSKPNTTDEVDENNIHTSTNNAPEAQPSKPVVSENKTYTNTAYHYTLQYPKGWTIGTLGDADPTTFNGPNFASSCNYDSGELCQRFMINTNHGKTSNGKTLDQFINDTLRDSENKSITSNKDITLGENIWREVIYNANDNENKYVYAHDRLYTIKDGAYIVIDYVEQQKDVIETQNDFKFKKQDQFHQVISTLKFTK